MDEYRKGHKELFHAFLEVKKAHPHAHLIVVGDGKKRFEFESLAVSLGLSDRIHFLGHRTDIAELNEIADIAVVPSIAFEGIPYTIREAMRAAKPVITTDAGGCDEAIEDGVSGLIIEQKNIAELADSICLLLGDHELRKKMGKKSREFFEKQFLLLNKVKDHEVIYESLVDTSLKS